MAQPDTNQVKMGPRHVAIIMDGNGRWAMNQNQHRLLGHQKGALTFMSVVEYVVTTLPHVTHLTMFGFAELNKRRASEEVNGLYRLFKQKSDEMLPTLVSNDVRTRVVGDMTDQELSPAVPAAARLLEKGTRGCGGLRLQIAWNYSGQNEIKRAQTAGWNIEQLYTTMFDAEDVPSIDLVIRTGTDNEVALNWRDSDFFPLLSAQAVKVPMIVLWPDFRPAMHFIHAINVWRAEQHLQGAQRKSL